jgi:hypothetical protein
MSSYDKFKSKYLQFDDSLEHILDQYLVWVWNTIYMIMAVKKGADLEYFAVKCAKRGNDVYRSRVNKRFNELLYGIGDLAFFERKKRDGVKRTRALFVTLTWDTKLCSWEEAWKRNSSDFNRFMANVRKRFGGVSCVRVYEASSRGYPHIHCILLFDSFEFNVFRDIRGRFRIRSKDVFERHWHSFVDIQAMDRLGGGLGYLRKYLMKGCDVERADSKGLLTLALTWAFGKRAFSISGKLNRVLREMSEDDDSYEDCEDEFLYIVIGFVSARLVDIEPDVWFMQLDVKWIENWIYGGLRDNG